MTSKQRRAMALEYSRIVRLLRSHGWREGKSYTDSRIWYVCKRGVNLSVLLAKTGRVYRISHFKDRPINK